jgi:alpha-beta hydrolase superfamily lysophospholipase
MPTEQILYFDADGYQLAGTLHLPDIPTPPVVVGCHGLLADRNSAKQISLASACNQIGVAYFRFDHRGCGESQGNFSEVTTLSARRQDLYHAIQTMQHQSDVGPLKALFGSSFGGTVVLSYAAKYPAPKLITYAAPINSASIDHSNIRDNDGQSPSKSLLTDALEFNIVTDLTTVGNILVAHSQNDETVPVEHAHKIFKMVKDPKKTVIFEGGDHRMSDTAHQQRFEKNFIDWLEQMPSL